MFAITPNPGFVLILGALALLAAPASLRSALMVASALGAMWLLTVVEFGDYDAFAQIGLTVIPYAPNDENFVFGVAFIAAAIFLSIYAGARRNRYECAAILLLAGASASALFVGDFISLVACVSLAGLAGAWVASASEAPGASGAGVRLLIWHGLEGLFYIAGVAIHISAEPSGAPLEPMQLNSLGGAFVFAALMIRVGAPFAHVWLKDALAHASGAGAGALSAFSIVLGVYALARLFPGEALLAPIGAAMIVIGALYCAAEDDVRAAAGYALIAQAGICVALTGLDAPLARAAAAAYAFNAVFAFMLMQMALGAVAERLGSARLSAMAGLARAAPMTSIFVLIGAWAGAGAPGLSGYAALALGREALEQGHDRALWLFILIGSAALFASLLVRTAIVLMGARADPIERGEAPFAMGLAMSLASFVCVSIAIAPSWLYNLARNEELNFQPYDEARLGAALQLFAGAGITLVIARWARFAMAERAVRVLDVDALYRGPFHDAGHRARNALLSAFNFAVATVKRTSSKALAPLGRRAGWLDLPYGGPWRAGAGVAAICALLALILTMRF
jgi:multicomponent Na+:H+ antiporter subunit D